MSGVMEKKPKVAAGACPPQHATDTDKKLQVAVVFTSVRATLVALKEAARLADKLNARITLMVPQVVPFPAPLEYPPVLREFSEQRFRVMAEEIHVGMDVRILLCRDRFNELRLELKARTIVLLFGRRRSWPGRLWPGRFLPGCDARLARRLQCAGYEVIFTETEY